MLRFITNLFIILSIFILPVYITAIIIIFSIFNINNFFESILWAYLLDQIYNGGNIFGINFTYFFTIISFIIYLASFKIKAALRI